MIILIKPRLMESVVFEAARLNPRDESGYHKEFAACYDESDPDRRESAFRALHERWFDRLGFRGRLTELLGEFHFVRSLVTRLVVSDVIGARRQAIELFGAPGRHNVVINICPALFLNTEDMNVWIRHELQHIDDMLDPAFGFDRSLVPRGATVAAMNLHRDRYALLWAISIDARLMERGRSSQSAKDKRRREFTRAFGRDDASLTEASFSRLWDSMRTERPTHTTLLEWARDCLAHLLDRGEADGRASGPIPGGACPLCKFPTFDWMREAEMPDALASAVSADFERWNSADGICRRCAELYRHRVDAGLVNSR